MTPKRSILIVEDEADLAELISYNLEREGFQCRCCADGETALSHLREALPDLVVLDRMLPQKSGDDVTMEIRRSPATASVPIIMLTAKAEDADELVGFALGADDYVRKPFSMKLLVARISALLRRADSKPVKDKVILAGPISLDPRRYEVKVDGTPVSMTATEFRILKALMGAGGRVLERTQLIDIVLGADAAVTDRTIDVHISALRRKLGAGADWVQTVRGVGYAFRPPQ